MASSAETQWAQLDHQNHDIPQPNGPQNPRRAGLILKGVVITVAIALLPFYPSIPLEFTKRTILTRGWEFLQLVFVGILLCYGLFSRRRSDPADKENTDESAQSYVAKILHVSPVFDVEMETVSPELLDSGRKVLQSWSSLYSPTDPVVVRRDESLLFPVANLKSNGVSDHEVEESGGYYGHDMHEFCGSCSVSTKESGRQSGEFSFNRNSGENLKGDAVLPSPVPWRSRSGKMEEENSSNTGAEEPESLPALRSPIPWNSRPNSANTPSTSTSASRPVFEVSQTPPKPSSISKSTTAAADSSQLEIGSAQKQKSTRRELKQMAESMDDDRASIGNSARMRSKSFSASSMANKEFTLSERESSASEKRINGRLMSKPESENVHSESLDSSATAGKSVRTIRRSETSNQIRTCRENDVSVSVPGEEKLGKKNKAGSVNLQQEIRKNVAAAAAEYVIVELPKEKQQIRDPTPIVETKKKDVDSDAYNAENSSSRRSKSDHSSVPQPPLMMMKRSLIQPPPPPPVELYEEYMSHWMKEKQKTYHIETHDEEDEEIDDYSDHDEEEDDHFEEAPPAALTSPAPVLPLAAEIDANEVDKKADEFIAKFREQIRLQRIETIKRATSSQNRKNKSAIRTAGNVT